MPDMKKYDNLAVSKSSAKMVRDEAKRTRRPIYAEAELLIEEAVKARRAQEKKK
jgi:hypothetical protein